MTYRPYPNPGRARRQIERHEYEAPPLSGAPARPLSPFEQKLVEGATAAVQAVGSSLAASLAKLRQPADSYPVDEYRLSTR
jgi:hypothetical protein